LRLIRRNNYIQHDMSFNYGDVGDRQSVLAISIAVRESSMQNTAISIIPQYSQEQNARCPEQQPIMMRCSRVDVCDDETTFTPLGWVYPWQKRLTAIGRLGRASLRFKIAESPLHSAGPDVWVIRARPFSSTDRS
jgi:hypothetical protein